MDLFNKTIDLARSIMDEGGFDPKTDIDAIVLVGGNTKIPKIQHLLKELFGREALKDGNPDEALAFNPDEALAFTATHIAGCVAAKDDGRFAICVPNSMSVGFELLGGVMARYVSPAETLPAKHYGLVTTCYDDQTTVEIKVFEGERRLTKYCHHLATLQISDLPPAPRGELMIKTAMEVDIYWNICVTAEHEASQKIKSITIPAEHIYNTVEEITQAFNEWYDFHKEDDAEEKKVQEALRLFQTPPLYSTKFAVRYPSLHY